MGSICIENRKVKHEYFIEETLECGISLKGNEVKSIRSGKASIKEAWIDIDKNQLVIKGMHITKWETSNMFDIDEKRNKVLLAHKKEIEDFSKKVKLNGYTIMPIKVYFDKSGRCKILIGLCKGKKIYDKRQSDKERTLKREIMKAR